MISEHAKDARLDELHDELLAELMSGVPDTKPQQEPPVRPARIGFHYAGIDYCPNRDATQWDFEDGRYTGPRCGASWCPYCGPRRFFFAARAMAAARPSHKFLVEGCFGRAETVEECAGLLRLAKRLPRALVPEHSVAIAFAVVPVRDASRSEWVVLGVLHGTPVDQARLSSAAADVGLGRAAIRPMRRDILAECEAMFRGPLGAKDVRLDLRVRLLADHLEPNGGRIVHSAGKFWRDNSGRPLRGLDEAISMEKRGWRSEHGI